MSDTPGRPPAGDRGEGMNVRSLPHAARAKRTAQSALSVCEPWLPQLQSAMWLLECAIAHATRGEPPADGAPSLPSPSECPPGLPRRQAAASAHAAAYVEKARDLIRGGDYRGALDALGVGGARIAPALGPHLG